MIWDASQHRPSILSTVVGGSALGLLILFAQPVSADTLPQVVFGKVTKVIRCEVVVVQFRRKDLPIRLNGVECPEKGQPYFKAAHRYVAFMTEGLEVTVRVVTSDKNGTLIGDVLLPDGRTLNYLIIEEGLAWWDRSSHSDRTLAEVEELAQASRRGLWEDPYPIPPWEWRKGRRNPEP